MEQDRKLALQHKVSDGQMATDIRLNLFQKRWFDSMKERVLANLQNAETYEELVTVREEYKAAVSFVDYLLSLGRDGARAAQKMKEDMQK